MAEISMPEPVSRFFAGLVDKLRPLVPRRFRGDIPVVPVVRLSGVIGFSTPLRPGLTLAAVARPLERAFAVRDAAAVALLINRRAARRYSPISSIAASASSPRRRSGR
jgi:hypothetical protein